MTGCIDLVIPITFVAGAVATLALLIINGIVLFCAGLAFGIIEQPSQFQTKTNGDYAIGILSIALIITVDLVFIAVCYPSQLSAVYNSIMPCINITWV
jgi:hypothetical protein